MEVKVDLNICQGHGQCEFAAPEVFELNDEGTVDYVSEPPAAEYERVRRAAKVCPVRAIALVD